MMRNNSDRPRGPGNCGIVQIMTPTHHTDRELSWASMTPAEAYIATLGSPESKATMRSALKKLASYLSALGPPFTGQNIAEPESFPWEAVHGEHADYIGARIDFDFSGRTRLKYISALRGVLKQCLIQGTISAKQFEEASSMERLLISDSKSL